MHTGTHILVVTANHFTIGDLVAEAVGGFIGVNWHVEYICRLFSTHWQWHRASETRWTARECLSNVIAVDHSGIHVAASTGRRLALICTCTNVDINTITLWAVLYSWKKLWKKNLAKPSYMNIYTFVLQKHFADANTVKVATSSTQSLTCMQEKMFADKIFANESRWGKLVKLVKFFSWQNSSNNTVLDTQQQKIVQTCCKQTIL